MTEPQFDFRLIDKRVFAVVFIFSLISTVLSRSVFLFLFLHAPAAGELSLLLPSVSFLINPILFFAVLYRYCGGPLLNRMARVLVSIIFASLVGFWIGGVLVSGAMTFLSSAEEAVANFYFLGPLLYSLPTGVIVQLLEVFAVLAFSDLVPKWRDALPLGEIRNERPSGVALLSALYVIFALLNTLALPVLAFWGTTYSVLSTALLAAFVGLLALGQIVLAMGLYRGKKWAWVLAVVSTGTALLIDVTIVGVTLGLATETAGAGLWLLAILFFGILISLAIVAYLLSSNVRKFFGLVNPDGHMS